MTSTNCGSWEPGAKKRVSANHSPEWRFQAVDHPEKGHRVGPDDVLGNPGDINPAASGRKFFLSTSSQLHLSISLFHLYPIGFRGRLLLLLLILCICSSLSIPTDSHLFIYGFQPRHFSLVDSALPQTHRYPWARQHDTINSQQLQPPRWVSAVSFFASLTSPSESSRPSMAPSS